DIGMRGDTRVGAIFGHGARDFNLAGWVETNRGYVQKWTGQELDINITGPNSVVVDAVVVAGGGRYNVYRNPRFLPPAVGDSQHYIAPFDTVHKIPNITSWFTCYHVDPASALPEVPQALDVPLAGGAVVGVWMIVRRQRRRVARGGITAAG